MAYDAGYAARYEGGACPAEGAGVAGWMDADEWIADGEEMRQEQRREARDEREERNGRF
jgi:hypothetical protein